MYECPDKERCINSNGEIAFQNRGFTSPCSHLNSCVAHETLEELHQIYAENLKLDQNNISHMFRLLINPMKKEHDLIDWVKLNVEESLPVGIVDKERSGSLRNIM